MLVKFTEHFDKYWKSVVTEKQVINKNPVTIGKSKLFGLSTDIEVKYTEYRYGNLK